MRSFSAERWVKWLIASSNGARSVTGRPKAGAGDLLLGRWLGLQLHAGNSVEFAHGTFQHHAKVAAHPGHGGAAQVQGGDDVMLCQPLGNLAAHTPNIAHGGQAQQVIQALLADLCQVAHARQVGQVSAGFALCILGDVVGQLGQGLGGRDAHAGGYADAALYTAADGVGAAGCGVLLCIHTVNVECPRIRLGVHEIHQYAKYG